MAAITDVDVDSDEYMVPIITHSDSFHADEVTAVALLSILFDGRIAVSRTRNQEDIDAVSDDTIVLDVGKVYDPDRLRFDHHQPSFTENYNDEFGFPMSSCGLVWRHYGTDILGKLGVTEDTDLEYTLYKYFFAAVDAGDNGVPYLSSGAQTNYAWPVTFTYLISQFNDRDDQDAAFFRAVNWARVALEQFFRTSIEYANRYAEEEPFLQAALERAEYSTDGVLVLSKPATCLNRFLRVYDRSQFIKFIVVPRNETEGTWNVWTVNYNHQRYNTYAKVLDQDHPALRDNSLASSGIKFVHKNGFIAVCSNRRSAEALAQASLRYYFRLGNYPRRVLRWLLA